MSETTNIRIGVDTWKRLNNRKGPGDSFDDVIAALLDEVEKGNVSRAVATAD
jgi:predicted CopG family antitoxin